MADDKKDPPEPQALREVLEGLSVRSQHAKSDEDAGDKKHAFWDTQPVPALSDELAVVPPEEHACACAKFGVPNMHFSANAQSLVP